MATYIMTNNIQVSFLALAGGMTAGLLTFWVLLTNGLDEGILMAAIGHIAAPRIHDAETIIPLP